MIRLFWLLLSLLPAWAAALPVAMSVLPQKTFVAGVGGPAVEALVVVPRGQDPALYQPTPRQLAALGRARLYVRAGVPFEASWLPRFRALNPGMAILDLREGIPPLTAADGSTDPHVWTDPLAMLTHVQKLAETLARLDPAHAEGYHDRAARLATRIQALHEELSRALAPLRGKTFLVYHPAWAYFARRYGLHQLAVEHEGKAPAARTLARLIERARQLGIDTLIVQPQHHNATAQAMARALGARIVEVDPLAEDWFASLRRMARVVQEAAR